MQLGVVDDKAANLAKAKALVSEAAANGAELVMLPEYFNSPCGVKYFPRYAEEIPNGESSQALSAMASSNRIYLVGGSMSEKRGDKFYNTCTVYNPEGEMIAKFSKIHLFDVSIPGKITFRESEVMAPGDSIGIFETGFGKFGLGICYDIRFPELALTLAKKGCSVLLYPGAFGLTTGQAHWEVLQRARAVDNQVYVAAASPARDDKASYVAWGHSTIVSPWGDVIAKAGTGEEIVYGDIDLDRLESVRSQMPYATQKRYDVYQL